MMRLLGRSAQRFYLRHPWQLALALAGISLGVAVYVGVDLANDSAQRAFELSEGAVTGRTTHRLLPIGGALDESVYRELVLERGVMLAAPVIRLDVSLAAARGVRYPLLGVDPLEETGLRGFSGFVPGARSDLARLIAEPRSVLVPEGLAEARGLRKGSPLALNVNGRIADVTVIGIVQSGAADAAAETPIVADLATAQELLGRPGFIDYVDLRLDAAAARALASSLPPGTTLVEAGSQRNAFKELAAAFRTNLTALGLLALVVGAFLIYGTMSFAVVQRRSTLGILRALGVRRRELVTSILLEALALGGAATLLGLGLGHALASGLVDLVLRTIGDLYFSAAVGAAAPSPWIYAKGAALGLGATLLAALKPALDAAAAPLAAVLNRASLERGARAAASRLARLALPALGVAAVVLAASPRSIYGGFAGLFCVLAAGAMLTPAATLLLMKLLERPMERVFGLPGVLSVRGVGASLSRTGVATAALAIAVATVVGIGLMIASFRASLVDWLSTTLTADVYVAFDGDGIEIEPERLAALAAVDGVSGMNLTRTVRVPTPEGEITVRAIEPGQRGWGLDIVRGDPEHATAALETGAGIVIAEPFAFARRLDVGDALVLPTASGEERFPIIGVYRDYNTGGRAVTMALELYRRHWRDAALSGIGLYTDDDAERRIETALRETLPPAAEFRMRSSAAIERLSLEVFDRTFKITEVLRVLAGVVAFFGILSALLSIELERSHELAVLRALGFAPRQLAATLLTQTALLGLAAAVAALPLGTALAALLVHVINRRSFGWAMDFLIVPSPLAAGLALAIAAAVLAGIYPAVRSSRVELAAALREE